MIFSAGFQGLDLVPVMVLVAFPGNGPAGEDRPPKTAQYPIIK
jgi:hypothetical protein